jgi:hypothetical protein
MQLLEDSKENVLEFRRGALDHSHIHFGRGYGLVVRRATHYTTLRL